MGFEKSGGISKHLGYWTARLVYHDPDTGKRREVRKRGKRNTKAAAQDKLEELRRIYAERGPVGFQRGAETFEELAAEFQSRYVCAPEYRQGKLIRGRRGWRSDLSRLTHLRRHLGPFRLRAIGPARIEDLRADLLDETNRHGRKRSLADVNRYLELARRLFNFAVENHWMGRNPIPKRIAGEPFIDRSAETIRQRTLSRAEERALLATLENPVDPRLYGLVIAALDCGARQGELLKVRNEDVDVEAGTIVFRATHTKTLKERAVPISARLAALIPILRAWEPPKDATITTGAKTKAEDRLFRYVDFPRWRWDKALEDAKIKDFHFHDLRRTCNQRLLEKGIGPAEASKLLGHELLQTNYQTYVAIDAAVMDRARSAIDAYNADAEQQAVN
jgi:integrase